jgi:hypothetical protein
MVSSETLLQIEFKQMLTCFCHDGEAWPKAHVG